MPTADVSLPEIFGNSRTIGFVGLSDKPARDSHQVAAYMQRHGYRIIPINPTHAGMHILSEHCYATLPEAVRDLGEQGIVLDVVNCFRRAEAIPEIAAQALGIGARTLWMPLGVINDEAARIARNAGMDVVMDRCMMVEHRKWLAAGSPDGSNR